MDRLRDGEAIVRNTTILPQLPPAVLADAPDYERLRTELLGIEPDPGGESAPAAELDSNAANVIPIEADTERQP